MKNIKVSEHQLQKAILGLLKYYKDIYVIRNNSFAGQIIRGDGSKGWISNSHKGSPDIILCDGGLWIGLEIKTNKGRQSPEQKQAEKDIRQSGGRYFIIRSLEQMQNYLDCR